MQGKAVEKLILKLKEDFYVRLGLRPADIPIKSPTETDPSISLLTDEELQQLELAWVELSLWKNKQDR
ncbi:hypothetical protein AB4259_18940 [Vibrio amylolyticus]|uniref:hypothetical protein n=1 Tax=Vibrio TaxID=662 RepID=UPI000C81D52D|nr:hypothetical protein [Vibrio sp. 10N.261.55.A7]PMJ92486.1 hypothetical protein BCU12_07975 [Vibrio sp. 10N.261.55.A7]